MSHSCDSSSLFIFFFYLAHRDILNQNWGSVWLIGYTVNTHQAFPYEHRIIHFQSCGMESARCWKHSFEKLLYFDMAASQSLISTDFSTKDQCFQTATITTPWKGFWVTGRASSSLNSMWCSQNQIHMTFALWWQYSDCGIQTQTNLD